MGLALSLGCLWCLGCALELVLSMSEAAVVAVLAVPILEILAQERLVVGAVAAAAGAARLPYTSASPAILRARVEVVPAAIVALRVAIRHATAALVAAASAVEASVAPVGGPSNLLRLRWVRLGLLLKQHFLR